MRQGDVTETKVANIFSYLRQQNLGCDFNLSNKQSADVVAFISMMEEKLLPALLHTWWIDSQAYVDVTRPWYAKASPFPLNLFVPGSRQKWANKRVFVGKGSENISETDVEAKIYKDARECLNNLAHKLGEKDYFFGNSPSSLDAVVFGYVAPLLKAPLNTNQLINHLKQCDNLGLHCSRILRLYFPLSEEEMEKKRKQEERKQKESENTKEFPNKKRNMILAGIFAATSMVTYAFLSGLISIEVIDQDPLKVDPH